MVHLLPLSPSQRGLWFAQQLNPDIPFTTAQYVEFRGDLDADLVRDACNQAAREVESGTLVLVEQDGKPFQKVVPDIEDAPRYLDLRSEKDPEAAAHRWMTEQYTKPLDLLSDRLIATTVLRIADDRYFLSSYVHHIALDGQGAVNMLNRAAELYSAWVSGSDAPPLKRCRLPTFSMSRPRMWLEASGHRPPALARAPRRPVRIRVVRRSRSASRGAGAPGELRTRRRDGSCGLGARP